MSDTFAHLHVHTEFSMLDGAARIAPLFAEAERLGMSALAMTDHGNMFGAAEFYRESRATSVKPILGIEAYIAPCGRFHKKAVFWGTAQQRDGDEYGEGGDVPGAGAYTHMTMLADGAAGLRNLFRLSSLASAQGFYRRPRMDRELIGEHAGGVIATTGCPSGEVQTRLRLGQRAEALQSAADYRDVFGPENFFVELMDHGLVVERSVRDGLLEIGRALNLRPVATNDSHYVTRDQAAAHAALLCVQSGRTLADPKRFRFEGDGYYLKSPEEMRAYWDAEVPGAADNTMLIAERIGTYDDVFAAADRMPRFPVPDGETPESWLAAEVDRGLECRYPGGVPDDRRARAEYELGVIAATGFADYFLIVADLCRFCRERGVRTNTRGSAAGSIVAYALNITDLDPVEHRLMFERFLNPDRVSPPDIDVDVDDSRRGEVVRYLTDRWGADRVAQITTISRIKGRAAIKDAARVLGESYALGNRMTKVYPPTVNGFDAPLSSVTDPAHPRHADGAALREIRDADPAAAGVLGLAVGVEGLARQAGVHAAGVLLSSEPLVNVLPLWTRDDGAVIAGFDWVTCCEHMGLLKVDVLGSRNLGILDAAVANIAANGDGRVDLPAVPLDDGPTFELLSRGDTLGVFQLDGRPIRDLLRRMAPTRFGDIVATIALYRPGPMGANAHNDYADRKNGRQPITPIHPELVEALEPVLGETCGVICFQEQVIEVARRVAGYTLARADILRRAMGKKKPAELVREKPVFVAGMAGNGFSENAALALWDVLVPFSAYAFNRAHAVSYAMIGYWTAYLKANHPAEYMAAVLSSVGDNKDRMALYLAECRRMGLRILPPDVTSSGHRFTVVPGGIRFGLDAVRNVGAAAAEAVIRSRSERGTAGTFHGFLRTTDLTRCGKRAVESLIKAGACDVFGHTRRALDAVHASAVEQAAAVWRAEAGGQGSLFGDELGDQDGETRVPALDEWPREVLLAHEREVLGLYVSAHPLDGAERAMMAARTHQIVELLADGTEDVPATIAGLVTNVDRRTSKSGKAWAIMTMEDLDASIEVTLFARACSAAGSLLTRDAMVVVQGRTSRRGDRASVVGTTITALDLTATESDSPPAVATPPPPDLPAAEQGRPANEVIAFAWACLAPHYDR